MSIGAVIKYTSKPLNRLCRTMQRSQRRGEYFSSGQGALYLEQIKELVRELGTKIVFKTSKIGEDELYCAKEALRAFKHVKGQGFVVPKGLEIHSRLYVSGKGPAAGTAHTLGKIRISASEYGVFSTTIHEIGHKLHSKNWGFSMFEWRGKDAKYFPLIKEHISDYATTHPDEFIADTFRKMSLNHNWNWNAVPPEIKGLYARFLGPEPGQKLSMSQRLNKLRQDFGYWIFNPTETLS